MNMMKDHVATSSENNRKNACKRKNYFLILFSENRIINPLKLLTYDTD